MGISQHPCKVTMPPDRKDCATVLDFLIARFARIDADIWRQRIADGKVHWLDKTPVTAGDRYAPNQQVFYYREVEQEAVIPFQEEIIYQDDEILVACKPHFLPVTPTGKYVEQCLLNRLRQRTGIQTLAPMHRIDRETAGIVLFSVNPENRDLYHALFRETKNIHKTYRAVGWIKQADAPEVGQHWSIKNRLEQGEPWFRMTSVEGDINARSEITCLAVDKDKVLFELQPITGKTHQLRVHMNDLGYPLVNDQFYPSVQPENSDDFDKPLQLLAWRMEFIDPVTSQPRMFESRRALDFDYADDID